MGKEAEILEFLKSSVSELFFHVMHIPEWRLPYGCFETAAVCKVTWEV